MAIYESMDVKHSVASLDLDESMEKKKWQFQGVHWENENHGVYSLYVDFTQKNTTQRCDICGDDETGPVLMGKTMQNILYRDA